MPPMKGLIAVALPLVLGACVVQDRAPPGPNIAFGYSDGYWDRGHQWHAWRDREEAQTWQRQNPAHYYERRHDEEATAGWHDGDRWWEPR